MGKVNKVRRVLSDVLKKPAYEKYVI